MDFKISESVIYNGTEAEVLATKKELGNSAKIKLTINDKQVKEILYSGNFDYLIGVNKSSIHDIGNLIFCSTGEKNKINYPQFKKILPT